MNILLWIIIWYTAFAGYYLFFKKRNILYKNRPKLIVGWYGLMSLIGISVFHTQIKWAISNPSIIGVLVAMIMVSTATMLWYRSLTQRSYVDTHDSRNIFFSKTSEIIFQQVMVWALFGILQGVLLVVHPVIVFALSFFIFHIPFLAVIFWKKALFFVLASTLGGLFFAACLMYIPSGWLVALAGHIIFYAYVAFKKKIWGMDTFYVM